MKRRFEENQPSCLSVYAVPQVPEDVYRCQRVQRRQMPYRGEKKQFPYHQQQMVFVLIVLRMPEIASTLPTVSPSLRRVECAFAKKLGHKMRESRGKNFSSVLTLDEVEPLAVFFHAER